MAMVDTDTVESRTVVTFDYTAFLAESCKKKWSFIDAIYSVIPLFGFVLNCQINKDKKTEDRLRDLALQILSTQISDENNIARLIRLAKQQKITHLRVCLPYALNASQLSSIEKECPSAQLQQQDEFLDVNIH
ncbi:MAG: hypothetical protein ACRDDP_00665 [Plesiomonas sp.]